MFQPPRHLTAHRATERSQIPVAPLEWRRLEKAVYGNDYDEGQDDDKEDEGGKSVTLVPPIKPILRVPQEPFEPLGKKHKRQGRNITVDPEPLPFPEAQ